MAEWLNESGRQPEQVQDFYPTPGTLSTCMYYTGLDPRTLNPVYVPRSAQEKEMQRALLQWKRPEKRGLVIKALREAGREDLIGFSGRCLLRPLRPGSKDAVHSGGKPSAQTGSTRGARERGSATSTARSKTLNKGKRAGSTKARTQGGGKAPRGRK